MTNRHLLTDVEVRRMKGLKAPAYKIHKFLTMEDVLTRGDTVSGPEESLTIPEETPDES